MIEQPVKPKKKSLDPVATKAKILEASARLFSQHGYDSVSLSQIAEVAQFPKSLVAYHFGSKEELWAQVTEMLMQPGIQAMDRFLAGHISVGELLLNRLALFAESPTRSRFIAWVSLTDVPMPRPLQERKHLLQERIHEIEPETLCRCLLAVSMMDGWYLNKQTYSLLMGEEATSLLSDERMQAEVQKLLSIPEVQP